MKTNDVGLVAEVLGFVMNHNLTPLSYEIDKMEVDELCDWTYALAEEGYDISKMDIDPAWYKDDWFCKYFKFR